MPLMAKKKDSGKKPPARTGKPVHAYIDPAIHESFDRFRMAQRIRPTIKDALELALKYFLESEGYWPPETDTDDSSP